VKRVHDWLRGQSTLTLATISREGAPAAADLYFVADQDLQVYFISERGSRHAAHVGSGAPVAATVHGEAWDWQEIRGVQLEGDCRPVDSARERAAALALYGRKFTFLHTFAAVLPQHTLFVITPRWIRWLDNGAGFGYRQEWTREDGQWIRQSERH
jgi:uncharacterized protein YhbP (UPF0306 family)